VCVCVCVVLERAINGVQEEGGGSGACAAVADQSNLTRPSLVDNTRSDRPTDRRRIKSCLPAWPGRAGRRVICVSRSLRRR